MKQLWRTVLDATALCLAAAGFILAGGALLGATAVAAVAVLAYLVVAQVGPQLRAHPVAGLFAVWAVSVATWVTLRVFGENPPTVPTGTAAAYATLFILPQLAMSAWRWVKERSDVAG